MTSSIVINHDGRIYTVGIEGDTITINGHAKRAFRWRTMGVLEMDDLGLTDFMDIHWSAIYAFWNNFLLTPTSKGVE